MEISNQFELPYFEESDGKLVAIERDIIPGFTIDRVFYIYDVPKGESRANHACMNSDIVFVSISGSMKLSVEKKGVKTEYILSKKSRAIYVPAGSWIIASDFSENAIMIAFSNKRYKDCVYVDDYAEYRRRDK